ncbi:MAG: hypothetical protein ACRD19_11575 [Terriglobia bacterium]
MVRYDTPLDRAHAAELKTVISRLEKDDPTLVTLTFEGQRLGDEGARALAQALKVNRTLTALNLAGNRIEDSGARALADALKSNKTLVSLDLSTNGIGEAGACALAEALKDNRTLSRLFLAENPIELDGRGMAALDDCQTAREAKSGIGDGRRPGSQLDISVSFLHKRPMRTPGL